MTDDLTTTEAAAQLGVAPETVAHYIRRDLIHATKRGRDWFISAAELARFQRDRKPTGRPRFNRGHEEVRR